MPKEKKKSTPNDRKEKKPKKRKRGRGIFRAQTAHPENATPEETGIALTSLKGAEEKEKEGVLLLSDSYDEETAGLINGQAIRRRANRSWDEGGFKCSFFIPKWALSLLGVALFVLIGFTLGRASISNPQVSDGGRASDIGVSNGGADGLAADASGGGDPVGTSGACGETEASLPAPCESLGAGGAELWKFYDGFEGDGGRPVPDYCAVSHRDVEDFPPDAWQGDAAYVNHFLDAGSKLVRRTMDSIYEEYGMNGVPGTSLNSSELAARKEAIFQYSFDGEHDPAKHGGVTTKRSFAGLVRRLLHAMMTRDSFTVVVAGHSAAAGHGNNFKQNYAMQFHTVMQPVLERLGVKLVTRNICYGGLGTVQSFMAGMDLLGPETDILHWDSMMTESGMGFLDFAFRQALLAGDRAPLLSIPFEKKRSGPLLSAYHQQADVDYLKSSAASGMSDLPLTVDEKQVEAVPYAARYLNCAPEALSLCKDNRFNSVCWQDHPGYEWEAGGKLPKKQNAAVGGQASWHPGFRHHRFVGRALAFSVLEALQVALAQWQQHGETDGFPLAAEYWHVKNYYANIQRKARAMPDEGACWDEFGKWGHPRPCSLPMHGKSSFTPRANPTRTSLRSILRLPTSPINARFRSPFNSSVCCGYMDWEPPAFSQPAGAVDVADVAAGGCGAQREMGASIAPSPLVPPRAAGGSGIEPGLGWTLEHADGLCNGEYGMRCLQDKDLNCLMSGHADMRGGWQGDCLSGWIVMDVKGVRNGLIVLKLEMWHQCGMQGMESTEGWTEVNNGTNAKRLLKGPKACETLAPGAFLEFAVNGVVTTLNTSQAASKVYKLQRVVELLTVLDQAPAAGAKPQDYEVALRIRNCDRVTGTKIRLTHVYWS